MQSLYERLSPYPQQFSTDMDLPAYEGPVRTYLIASTARSGSHMLGHMLKDAGPFGVPLEYLHRANLKLWMHRFGTEEVEPTLREVIRHRTGPTGWFGLKAHWHQFAPFRREYDISILGDLRAVFWIYRRDILGQAISYTIAAQTGQWISGAPRKAEPRYDFAAIERNLNNLRAENNFWGSYLSKQEKLPVLRVAFEDLVDPSLRPTLMKQMLERLDADMPSREQVDEPVRTQRQSASINDEWREAYMAQVPEERLPLLKLG
ncbi:Stf0 family sulfotransferase [Paracoccus sp. TOH]|uniref:Stf0 family sulfotransferase n=1 Tax=Paracoccus sp. TOH TaxID=1263728 RepID=UPI0025AFB49D|nr:Stf0 family sulfotransferase [Paracoccus sp. TOH]WJS86011.1 Stf0 family sulfotransferase [Paracoccus sp. TOH]